MNFTHKGVTGMEPAEKPALAGAGDSLQARQRPCCAVRHSTTRKGAVIGGVERDG